LNIIGQNFDRKALHGEMPYYSTGAIGAFNKQVLLKPAVSLRYLSRRLYATIRILKAGYTVVNEENAIAYTEHRKL
jgi:hypothetical protein